jgi:hypothetical protein
MSEWLVDKTCAQEVKPWSAQAVLAPLPSKAMLWMWAKHGFAC